MRIGVRGKVFAVSMALMVGVGLASGAYLEGALRTWIEHRIESELVRHAGTVRDTVELAGSLSSPGEADRIADRVATSTEARVTIIASDGTVLGDSDVELADIDAVENHRNRPEVLEAGRLGRGMTRRYSTTVRAELLYVAVPYQRADEGGVVRVAMPLSEVDEAVGRLRIVLGLGGLIGLVLALLLAGLASHLFSRPIRKLAESARAASAGGEARRLSVPSGDELGRLAGSFNQLVDDLEATVAKLAGERDRLETILQGMGEAVVALDDDNRITLINDAAARLLEVSESPAGRSLLEVVRAPALTEAVQRALQEGRAEEEIELGAHPRRLVLVRVAPLQTTGGAVLVMLDISDIRRLETVRRDFVANVSHELRTPVSVIRANAETLVDGAMADAEHGPTFLRAIVENTERLTRIIADLLDLSRIESGRHTLDLRPRSVGDAVRAAVDGVREAAGDKGLTLEIEEPMDQSVRADGQALDQILLNLLDNAVKYTPEGGRIEVRANGTEKVRIEILDDGPGIDPRHHARLFERFYRVDTGRSRELGGTGLGLSIVKNLSEAMGGSVAVEARSPRGSLFRVTLPGA